jgi:hypothetical protein
VNEVEVGLGASGVTNKETTYTNNNTTPLVSLTIVPLFTGIYGIYYTIELPPSLFLSYPFST